MQDHSAINWNEIWRTVLQGILAYQTGYSLFGYANLSLTSCPLDESADTSLSRFHNTALKNCFQF